MVTHPLIDNMALLMQRSCRNVVASRHWLKQTNRLIISGIGGGSVCRFGLDYSYSTQGAAALSHSHFGEGIDLRES